MTTDIVFYICQEVCEVSAIGWVNESLRKAARNTPAYVDERTGARVATHPAAVRAAGWSALVVGVLGAALIVGYDANHGALFVGIAIAVGTVTATAATVADFTRVRVEWTEAAVSISSPWSAPRRLRWDEIVEVRYSSIAGWFVVRGRDGTKIRLSLLLGGLGELLDETKRRVRDEVPISTYPL